MSFVIKKKLKRATPLRPGARGMLYIAVVDDIDVLFEPLPLGTGTVAGDEVVITGTHTFLPVSPLPTPTFVPGFVAIPLKIKDGGKVGVKTEGDYGKQKISSMIDVKSIGYDEEYLEILYKLQGKSVIVIVQDGDCDNPRFQQVGCKCDPVDVLNWEVDNESNDIQIKGIAECRLAIYKGVITEMVP